MTAWAGRKIGGYVLRNRLRAAAPDAAPAAAVIAGLAAEFADFRELRWPLLALVLAGVTITAATAIRERSRWRAAAMTVALGALTWGAAETIYVLLHLVRGGEFTAERFGDSQAAQALGLIAVHAVALGVPTGAVAAALLALWPNSGRWLR